MHRIRDLRKSKGFTQKKLADAAGLSMETLSRYERGEREHRITEMSMIAKALDCSIKDILLDEESNPTQPPPLSKKAARRAGAKRRAVNEEVT